MPITDNRTLLNNADTTTGWVTNGTLVADTEIFFQGTASIADQVSNTEKYFLYNAGSPQDWSNNHFFFLINCGVVGRLLTKAAGGLKIRFTGAAVTDFFEVYVAGSDSWPASFAGGWTLFVVDIETARSTAITNGWTGGTPPATTAVQHTGFAATTSAMTRNVDNTWIDAVYRLPDGSAGIVVTGQNGASDWVWNDVLSTSETNTWAMVRTGAGGSYVLSTPIQFGDEVASQTHRFSDTNVTLLWDNQEFIAPDFYGFTALCAASSTNQIIAGVKSGSGSTATGQLGWAVQAASTGERWYFNASDPDLTLVGLYGCNFSHGALFNFANDALETISSFFVDCTEVIQSLSTESSIWLRNTVVDADTLDGVAFLKSVDISNISYSTFNFSDGHAIEITSLGAPATFSSVENTFVGYGATTTNDAAVYNNSAQAVTIDVTGGTPPSYRNGTSASTTVNATVTITLTGLKDDTEVRVYSAGTTTELAGTEAATVGSTNDREFSFSATPASSIDIRIFNINWITDPLLNFTVPGSSTSIPIAQRIDRVFSNV